MSTAAGRQQPQGAQQSSGVHELTLSCRKLTRIEGLEGYRRLRILDLSCNRLDRIQGLSHSTVGKRPRATNLCVCVRVCSL